MITLEINISKLNDHIKSFEDLIQNYEDESSNLYHSLKDSSIYWEDERSNLFFEYIEKDRSIHTQEL